MKKNLTNAELIAILSKRDPNAPADILVDWCVCGIAIWLILMSMKIPASATPRKTISWWFLRENLSVDKIRG